MEDEDDPSSGSSLATFFRSGILRGPGSDIDLSFLWVLTGLPGVFPGEETYLAKINYISNPSNLYTPCPFPPSPNRYTLWIEARVCLLGVSGHVIL